VRPKEGWRQYPESDGSILEQVVVLGSGHRSIVCDEWLFSQRAEYRGVRDPARIGVGLMYSSGRVDPGRRFP
jgi:hypothetical protein